MNVRIEDELYNNLYRKYHGIEQETFISDLNIYEVFESINETKTIIGRQYLFKTLCNPKSSIEEINILESEIKYFLEDKDLRKCFNASVNKLKDTNMYLLPELFYSEKFVQPKFHKIASYLLSLELIILCLSYFYFPLLAVLLPLLFVNTFIHFSNKNRLYFFKRTYHPVSELLESSKVIKGKDSKNVFYTERVDTAIKSLLPLRFKLTVLATADYFSSSELYLIFFILIEIIKTLTLFEVLLTKSLISSINEKKREIKVLYKMIGKLDLIYSIFKLRENTKEWCYPTFTIPSDKTCQIQDVYHPLLQNPVTNSISLTGKSIVIAGSNMSGKTTFLRTVGINNILAQTINTCFALKFQIPFLKTVTSLHNSDNIIEGESFYFAEAKNLLDLLSSDSKVKYLIIIDEIFKGTNSLERTAISKATLNFLHQNCGIVFATFAPVRVHTKQNNSLNMIIENTKLGYGR